MTQALSLEQFQEQIISKFTDVIGEKLGGKILSYSDQWFADAENLIKPKPQLETQLDLPMLVPGMMDGKQEDTMKQKQIGLLSSLG